MPYVKVHHPDQAKPWCIHKRLSDGSAGETMGCSATEDLANGMLAALHTAEERSVVRSVGDQGEIELYLALWGDPQNRDSYSTWFDPAQPPDLGLKGGKFLPQRLMYEHGYDGGVRKEIIGEVIEVWYDKVGIGARALLDKSGQFFGRVMGEIRQKLLKVSTATAEHLADFDDEGRFVNWYLAEVSLTSDPSESRMPAVALVRSAVNCIRAEAIFPEGAIPVAGSVSATSLTIHLENAQPSPAVIPAPQESVAIETPRGSGAGADVVRVSKSEPTKRKRTMPMTLTDLGLGADATLEDVVKSLVDKLGPKAAEAYLDSINPSGAEDTPLVDPSAGDPTMMSAEARSLIARVIGKAAAKPNGNGTPPPAEASVTRAEFDELKRKMMTEPPVPETPTVRTNNRITGVVDRRYDHLTAEQMALGYQVAQALESRGRRVDQRDDDKQGDPTMLSDTYLRAMAHKTARKIEQGDKVFTDPAIRSKFPFKNAADVPAIRANEVMGTGQSSFGSQYATDLTGSSLWEAVRYQVNLFQAMEAKGMDVQEIPQGWKSTTIPIETGDPTWYVASESTDVDATSGRITPKFATSKSGTSSKQVTVAKLSVAIPFSAEETEDSIIAFAPEQMRKIQVTAPQEIESVLVNGDTDGTASTNINLIDGTPNATTTKPDYLLLNGFRKLALVTNTANSRDGGALDEQDFLETMKLMPGNYRQDRTRLLFVFDPDTGVAISNIPTVKTRDVFSAATLEEGFLKRIFRVDCLESGFMFLSNTAGKISATPGNNVKGSILLVRPDRWTFRWKRRLQIETDYNPYADANTLVAHMRFGVAFYDNEASAISYNLTI